MEIILTEWKKYLTLLAVPVLIALLAVPCFASDTAQPQDECWICGVKGVPFPDEEINCHVGQVIDKSVISEINRLVEERYPGHYTSFTFKPIEYEKYNVKDIGGQDAVMWQFHKILLVSYLDHGVISPEGEVLESPVAEKVKPLAGPYPYSGSLNQGYGRVHGRHYLSGTYVFESHTSWTPNYADMGIGLMNLDTEIGVTQTYTSSPADDFSYNWDYPYYYGLFIANLSSTTVSYSGYYYYYAE